MWEDPANCNGGAFSFKINHRISYSIWRTITYLAIGEQLDNTNKNIITGITISPKKNFSIIKINLFIKTSFFKISLVKFFFGDCLLIM